MSHITIIELPPFSKKAAKIFSDSELEGLKDYLKQQPNKGDVIAGTSGARKMRWASGGKGKRGGARVIYFYYVSDSEIFLMTCYSKSSQENISPAEKKQLREIIKLVTGE